VLLYSAADVIRWESLIEKSASEAAAPEEVIKASRDLLEHMRRFCNRIDCRHRTLSQYFGQVLPNRPCGACDVCLNEIEGLEDSTITAQKILSCVARAGQQFGAEHIVDVLVGANTERVRRWRHHQLSTYGLLKDTDRKTLTNMLYQLLDDGLLDRTAGDRPVFKLNENSMAVLRGHRVVQLLQSKTKVRKTRFDEDSWEGVNRGLFEVLRTLRLETAEQRKLPSYVLFSDATLREMARLRPGSPEALLGIRGVGEQKMVDLGPRFLEAIAGYCKSHGLPLNTTSNGRTGRKKSKQRGDAKPKAFQLFAQGESLELVAEATDRAVSTVCGYLIEFIQTRPAQSVDSWVTPDTYRKVADAVRELGGVYLKPVFDRLEGTIPYEQIRIVVTHLEIRGE
jgi:ATP-dependent DNA helicase RecQ